MQVDVSLTAWSKGLWCLGRVGKVYGVCDCATGCMKFDEFIMACVSLYSLSLITLKRSAIWRIEENRGITFPSPDYHHLACF